MALYLLQNNMAVACDAGIGRTCGGARRAARYGSAMYRSKVPSFLRDCATEPSAAKASSAVGAGRTRRVEDTDGGDGGFASGPGRLCEPV